MVSTYITYKITAPDGLAYIGATKATLRTRWGQHQRRSLKDSEKHRPFYQAISRYGADSFALEVLDTVYSKEESKASEIAHIAAHGLENLYNLSPGGDYDLITATDVFWKSLKADPKAKAAYLVKLCEAQRGRPAEEHAHLAPAGARWRKENPRDAWYISYRGLRCALRVNTTTGAKKASRDAIASRPLKERLLAKHLGVSLRKKEAVTKVWATRSSEEVATISSKIANSLKDKYDTDLTFSSANARQLAAARDGIDRVKQASAASNGLKQYWVDLKKDPERYAAYRKKRKDILEAKR